jgi:DNA-binding transcriptional ArsR family regulator
MKRSAPFPIQTPAFAPSKVAKRWTNRLGAHFCPVSTFFLENYHRLAAAPGQPGLNSTEAMLVIHLVDFKWDERDPFPTVGTLATRMGLTPRHVRDTLKSLQERGYVDRIPGASGGRNRYDLRGLFDALEALMDADVQKRDEQAA